MARAEVRLVPASAGAARRAAARCLRRAGVTGTAVTDAVLLVVTELVTNAQRHAGGVTGLTLRVTRDRVELTVRDAGPAFPGGGPDRVEPFRKVGLQLIAHLSTGVTVTPGDGGKAITATVSLTAPAGGSAPASRG
ncbi:ATP-binding protein [Streptomyces sp. NPDC012888]|uniref:ATP-binding protein n=1 Tax=Streptomyces sp. NPDC012888 TaxID=3364855 RepID=UPI0036D192D3